MSTLNKPATFEVDRFLKNKQFQFFQFFIIKLQSITFEFFTFVVSIAHLLFLQSQRIDDGVQLPRERQFRLRRSASSIGTDVQNRHMPDIFPTLSYILSKILSKWNRI